MIKDPIVMTRRLALGGSVCASVAVLSATAATAQGGSRGTPVSQALAARIEGSLRGADLEKLVDLMHPAVRTVAWTGATELDVVGPAAYRSRYLAPYLSANPDFRMTVTKVLTNGTEVVAFYDVAATVDRKPCMWSGCNVYITDGERIVEQWIEQDLWWRGRRSPTVNSRAMAEQLDRHFQPQTTAANLAGMGRFVSYKNTMMPSSDRIAGFVGLLAANAVQTSWEPEGIILLANPAAISAKFQDGLLQAIPDFWETVRRAVIIGNMLVLLQVPSGNLVLPDNTRKYCAWYNCDVFFFEGDRIKYILFQRDVMYDQSQTAA
jgi:SnoaL-like domain